MSRLLLRNIIFVVFFFLLLLKVLLFSLPKTPLSVSIGSADQDNFYFFSLSSMHLF
jgi:hypothetical protein